MRKPILGRPSSPPPVIGIPRAMLFYRYEILWKNFFTALGVKCVLSPQTNKDIIKQGTAVSIDEACLSTKIFMGHVRSLIGKCDYILIPRISNFGIKRNMCTKFEALYDIARNTFRKAPQKFISYNVDYLGGITEEDAFTSLGERLGFSRKQSLASYRAAKKAETDYLKNRIKLQEQDLKKKGLKILIVSHSYVEMDPYIGKPVISYLRKMGAVPVFADLFDRNDALKQSVKVSPTLKWEFSRELVGSAYIYRDKIDGIILLSAFPCGPDSMVNEMIIRRFSGKPILNMVLDDQDGTAGVETRLESFIDILKFKGGEL